MFYTSGVGFEELKTVLKIYKKQNRTLEEVLSFFSNPDNIEKVAKSYPAISPISIQEAIKLDNTEQRMIALKIFSHEEIIRDLNAKVLDKQTIKKKQTRWNKNFQPYEYTFEDTYILYEVKGEKMGVTLRSWMPPQNIYFVKCKCASTDRIYYLYVPKEAAANKDAIEAIAWTMQIEGTPITKKQYLTLLYSET
jgi:hypothetical protein